MEYDYLESLKSKAVRSTVDALCLKVRGNAMGLVDAFGIPDELLSAPIVVS